MNESIEIEALAQELVVRLVKAGKTVATAESCTGGWIAKALTDISGSSQCFGYGIVSYCNGAKESMLGVNSRTLEANGAVSKAVVMEMAAGALSISGAHYAVAVSGIAGPDGGTDEKPVGTVWFAWAARSGDGMKIEAETRRFQGNRRAVRADTVIVALQGIRERLSEDG